MRNFVGGCSWLRAGLEVEFFELLEDTAKNQSYNSYASFFADFCCVL